MRTRDKKDNPILRVRKYMYKRGCWDEEKEEKWMKDSQKMVRVQCGASLVDRSIVLCLGDGSVCELREGETRAHLHDVRERVRQGGTTLTTANERNE